jgi:hypothetical protein
MNKHSFELTANTQARNQSQSAWNLLECGAKAGFIDGRGEMAEWLKAAVC